MHKRISATAVAILCLSLLSAARAQNCSRDCLLETADDYLRALVAHEIEAMGLMAPHDSPTGWE